MASAKDTATFFTHGTCQQYEQVLKLYPQALRLKADRRPKKPEELIKLDNWYQNELPKKIKSRGKDAHLIHEELVQCMKWKQIRGKFYPQLSYLVKVNTPRAVMAETKKAFRKLPNLEQAMQALSNLKGVGTTMASALLAAASPETAPFMADECLMAIPDIEGIDYTAKEYLKFASHIASVAERLNKAHNSEVEAEEEDKEQQQQKKDGENGDGEEKEQQEEKKKRPDAVVWSPHKVELALWTHYVVSEHKPELLTSIFEGTPLENGNSITNKAAADAVHHQNGDSLIDPTTSDESNQGPPVAVVNGKTTINNTTTSTTTTATIIDEDTTTSFTDNSPPSIIDHNDEETNDSVVSISESTTKDSSIIVSDDSSSLGDFAAAANNKRPLDAISETSSEATANNAGIIVQPACKKMRSSEDLGNK